MTILWFEMMCELVWQLFVGNALHLHRREGPRRLPGNGASAGNSGGYRGGHG